MKGVHGTRAKQCESDDGSCHIAFGRVMNEGQRNREYRRAEGAPFQNRVSEASGQEPMHTVGQHAVGPAGSRDGVEGGLRRRKIDAQQVQQEGRRADSHHCPGHDRGQAVFGRNFLWIGLAILSIGRANRDLARPVNTLIGSPGLV